MPKTRSELGVGGIVVCGGGSRRMGRSKAWLPFGSETLLQRTVRIVSGVVAPVVVAARPGQDLPELPTDVATVLDARDDCGPLAGIAAGLNALADRCEAAFVVSCDHPLITPAFIRQLIALLEDHPAVVVMHQQHVFALTAVYRITTRSMLSELLDADRFRASEFVKRCGAHMVSAEAFVDIDPDMNALRNINDPAQYEQMR